MHRKGALLVHREGFADRDISWALPLRSTFVISKFKGLSTILRDIHISTKQICRIEEKNKSNNQILQMTM